MFLSINDIKEIAEKLEQATGIEYSKCSFSSFKRAVTSVIETLNIKKVQELHAMCDDKAKLDQIKRMLEVPCTELFRDPGFWRSLRKMMLNKSSLRIWLPNLTNGYELYSLVTVLKDSGILDKAVIVANAVSQSIIDDVKAGVISKETAEVNAANFERLEGSTQYSDYVTHNEEKMEYRFNTELLKDVTFENRWFLKTPQAKYDVVIFRNILLNYDPLLHEKAMNFLTGTLDSNGLLAIGIKEQTHIKTMMFGPIDAGESIYGRMN